MGISQEIWQGFIKEYPEANSGKLSIDELNARMAKYMEKQNATPLEDFDGLSAHQMHLLLEHPLAENSPLKWIAPKHEDDLANVPILKLSQLLLSEIAKAKEVKLTTKGNLPIAICTTLVEQNLIEWEYMKYVKKLTEDNIPYIWPMKEYLLNEGLIKKRNNKLSLTKKGEKHLQLRNSEKLRSLLSFFTSRFNWQNLYELEDNGEVGNLGWAFSIYLLLKYGHEKINAQFYADKWVQAFRPEYWAERNNADHRGMLGYIRYAYECRFFESFAAWFGLANVDRIRIPQHFPDKIEVSKSEIIDKCFDL
ncbi:hypothetical protein [Sphingobacterium pedocola]|uniref:EF-hand domain-containing protein n=1 Tax=Sphingobacterium pedocola TaxID=2082722 RepID=A0ABR9T779_9SPHI|nr:hypothetical protein [Sphingobacterium pedocola]MBE8721216.1 hypothetical protein [Sphingobacterium pedocola]